MKMTKRIATMVACAVMAASSMVGMGASAADTQSVSLSNSIIATYADGVFNGIQKGAYYNGTSSLSILREHQQAMLNAHFIMFRMIAEISTVLLQNFLPEQQEMDLQQPLPPGSGIIMTTTKKSQELTLFMFKEHIRAAK